MDLAINHIAGTAHVLLITLTEAPKYLLFARLRIAVVYTTEIPSEISVMLRNDHKRCFWVPAPHTAPTQPTHYVASP